MQLVISAFPGSGKSTVSKNAEPLGLKQGHVHKNEHTGEYEISLLNGNGVPVFDVDYTVFDKEGFPDNYINYIKEVLNKFPNVVIMVSSHDSVRQKLAEENIPFTLAYPALELKGEYLERYEKRGSPENFINMMDHTWNKFLDSSESDPTPNHIVLGEGEYLLDKVYNQVEEVVTSAGGDKITLIDGVENMDNKSISELIPGFTVASEVITEAIPLETPPTGVEVTAAIVDVNADANDPDNLPSEPTGGIEVGVISVPEGTVEATLEGGEFEGTQPAVDASTVSDSAMGVDGNEDLELVEVSEPAPDLVSEEPRTELIEAKFDMQNDIDVLEEVLIHCSEPERGGLESLQDNSTTFQAAAEDIKNRYEIEVEPTLAGMEGFLETLKGVFDKVTEKLKSQPSKQELAIIKKLLLDADKAAELYEKSEWQEKQQFKNVGKAKLSIPQSLVGSANPESIVAVLKGFFTVIQEEHKEYATNAHQRMAAGLKIFNKFKNKEVPEDMGPVNEEIKELFPITPAEKPAPAKTVFEAVLNTSLVKGEIPVLKKDDIGEVVDILKDITKGLAQLEDSTLALAADGLSWDDFHKSKLWDAVDDDVSNKVGSVVNWEDATVNLNTLEDIYTKKMLVIAKFLEQWILNSVK